LDYVSIFKAALIVLSMFTLNQ